MIIFHEPGMQAYISILIAKESCMAIYTQAKPVGTPTWVDLASPDPEKSRSFYQAIFGWEYDVSGPEFGGYATARLGNYPVAGIGGNPPGAEAMPATWNLYFASHDIEADIAHATQLGAQLLFPAMVIGDFGSMASCLDPNGAAFHFWKAGQHIGFQLSDEPGSATWFELSASDAKKARDFYAALLGASAEPMPGDLEYYVLKHGDTMLCGIMQIDPNWGDVARQWSVYFAVDDADKTVERARAHGATILSEPEDTPYGRLATLRDPAGAIFNIMKLPSS